MALEWQGELSDQTLLRIFSLAEQLKPEFEKVELQRMMTINIGDAGMSNHTDGLGAVVFQKPTTLGTAARNLIVARNNCTFVVNDYSRWANMLEDAMKNFAIILPIIMSDKAITAIGLQYTDSFAWKEDPEVLEVSDVFRENSRFLPPNALSLKNIWHNHHGYVEAKTEPVKNSLLTNVNITVQDVSGERNIQVVMSHRAALEKAIRLSTTDYLAAFSDVENYLHNSHKELLGELLTPEAAAKINLTA
jgi:uncharacterized protein (TIGR04255 family)